MGEIVLKVVLMIIMFACGNIIGYMSGYESAVKNIKGGK